MIAVGDFMQKTNTFEKIHIWLNNAKKTVDCKIHGKDVKSYGNGQCVSCRDNWRHMVTQQTLAVEMNSKKLNANTPPLYINSTFDNYKPTNKRAIEALNICKNYNFKSNLLFIGNPGTGKTHLSFVLIEEALRLGMSAFYHKFYNLSALEKNQNEFKKILTCDFLVIDEFGKSASDSTFNPTDPLNEGLLFRIIDQRTDNAVKTMVISNLEGPLFAKAVSTALYSRLKQGAQDFVFDWEDYRLKAGK